MAPPRVCVLRAPGTNCDRETAHAFTICGAKAERVHVYRLLENPKLLANYQVFCIPGGFSYGDDIGAGIIFSRQLRGRLGDELGEFLRGDKLALGICNGFQVLLKAGVLPGGAEGWPSSDDDVPQVSLNWNDNGKYTAIWVRLKVAASNSVFLRGIDEIDLPVAHAEGKVLVSDSSLPEEWQRSGQVAMHYSRPCGPQPPAAEQNMPVLPYPHSPNGSVANIAGLCDRSGRILGLMPHPERFIDATQHPHWTRLRLTGDGDGLKLFRNAVEYFS